MFAGLYFGEMYFAGELSVSVTPPVPPVPPIIAVVPCIPDFPITLGVASDGSTIQIVGTATGTASLGGSGLATASADLQNLGSSNVARLRTLGAKTSLANLPSVGRAGRRCP